MQLELFFTAFDFYATMDNAQFPKADEDMTSSPFNDQGIYIIMIWILTLGLYVMRRYNDT